MNERENGKREDEEVRKWWKRSNDAVLKSVCGPQERLTVL